MLRRMAQARSPRASSHTSLTLAQRSSQLPRVRDDWLAVWTRVLGRVLCHLEISFSNRILVTVMILQETCFLSKLAK